MSEHPPPLGGVRVVDHTSGIAGAYCGKVLADAGADVVRVLAAGGDPFGGLGSEALFEFLHASKVEASSDDDAGLLDAAADVLLVDRSCPATTDRAANQIVVAITPFGLDGPWSGRPATEFTLQAAGGSTGFRGVPGEEPLAAGGRIGEWISGTYAALATIAALLRRRRGGSGELIDVAMLDCVATTMIMVPSLYASFFEWPPMSGTGRSLEIPSVEPTGDGYAVFTTNSAQQYTDFCVMIGHPELLEDKKLMRPQERFARRDEFEALVHEFTTAHTTKEVLGEAGLFRIPSGPVLNGATVLEFDHFVQRGVYGPTPSGRFVQPRVPYRINRDGARPDRTNGAPLPPPSGPLPLAGIRVVDCTAWWAGPAAGAALAMLGADVIKVESVTRPDLMRYASTKPPKVDEWWEWSPLFHSGNVGKRAITLDLTRPEGVDVFERLVETADVLIENYTPRVMDQFGLGWQRLHELNPDLIMTRMPAFGLDGPWRDNTGFAQTMECISGMAWLTGTREGPPVLVRGACDPLAGMHAVIGTLLAMLDRAAHGGGRMVEAVMVEAALNAAAEQVLEYSATGTVLTRDGNRWQGAAPQGVYPCTGDDRWLAIAITTDGQWRALRHALGDPAWAGDAALHMHAGRLAAHDHIDEQLRAWTSTRDADDVADALCAAGVPAATVIPSREVLRNPQLEHRRFFETRSHRVTGDHAIPGLPFRFSSVHEWVRRPAPTLGEHNDEVFHELGLGDDDIASLRDAGVIGNRPTGV
jgi:crotonobetainyl-CoA:carnitine CoA-transferase CaiB-like acyl-CoA transferase